MRPLGYGELEILREAPDAPPYFQIGTVRVDLSWDGVRSIYLALGDSLKEEAAGKPILKKQPGVEVNITRSGDAGCELQILVVEDLLAEQTTVLYQTEFLVGWDESAGLCEQLDGLLKDRQEVKP